MEGACLFCVPLSGLAQSVDQGVKVAGFHGAIVGVGEVRLHALLNVVFSQLNGGAHAVAGHDGPHHYLAGFNAKFFGAHAGASQGDGGGVSQTLAELFGTSAHKNLRIVAHRLLQGVRNSSSRGQGGDGGECQCFEVHGVSLFDVLIVGHPVPRACLV